MRKPTQEEDKGGRPLGDTTRRDGEGFRITESADGFTTTQFDRIVKGGRLFQDKVTLTEINAAIGRPDLIEHQDQILKAVAKRNDYSRCNEWCCYPRCDSEQLTRF